MDVSSPKSSAKVALFALGGLALGALITIALLAILGVLLQKHPLERTDPAAHTIWVLLPGLLVIFLGVGLYKWRPRLKTASSGFILGSLGVYIVVIGLFFSDPLGLGETTAPSDAEAALARAVPPNETDREISVPLSHYGASELANLRRGDGSVDTYVDATVPSTGPNVISVNPIDDFTWGAAAKSRSSGICHLVVIVKDQEDPSSTKAMRGELAKGNLCVGSAANPTNVQD